MTDSELKHSPTRLDELHQERIAKLLREQFGDDRVFVQEMWGTTRRYGVRFRQPVFCFALTEELALRISVNDRRIHITVGDETVQHLEKVMPASSWRETAAWCRGYIEGFQQGWAEQ